MESALFKHRNFAKRTEKNEAMPCQPELCWPRGACFAPPAPSREENIAAVLCACPLRTAGMSLHFLDVCFTASPLNTLHHPGCAPKPWFMALARSRSPRVAFWAGTQRCCHGKGCLLPVTPGRRETWDCLNDNNNKRNPHMLDECMNFCYLHAVQK